MNNYNWFDAEKALRLLERKMSSDQKKPTLYHCVRTASLLFYFDCSYETQISWILHDLLEDTDTEEQEISKYFWNSVLNIVKENSKDRSLPKDKMLEDLIMRCCEWGIESTSVKVANLYDNFCFYLKTQNDIEIERCKYLAWLVLKYVKPQGANKIFKYLISIMNYKFSLND